jgi:hypothetical protein
MKILFYSSGERHSDQKVNAILKGCSLSTDDESTSIQLRAFVSYSIFGDPEFVNRQSQIQMKYQPVNPELYMKTKTVASKTSQTQPAIFQSNDEMPEAVIHLIRSAKSTLMLYLTGIDQEETRSSSFRIASKNTGSAAPSSVE